MIEFFNVGYQIYLLPTIKYTHSTFLYGHRSIEKQFINILIGKNGDMKQALPK